MNEERTAYEITMRPVAVHGGVKPAIGRLFTLDKRRAEQIVNALPTHRSMREVKWSDLPAVQREQFERAERERT